MSASRKKNEPKRLRVQVQLPTDIAKALRKRSIDELKTVSRLLTDWVQSWKDKEK